ncbi:ABC transporter substrate-binding protein [Cupriavidus basilensis]
MGTGPFRFVQYERGQFVIAERNAAYWRKNTPTWTAWCGASSPTNPPLPPRSKRRRGTADHLFAHGAGRPRALQEGRSLQGVHQGPGGKFVQQHAGVQRMRRKELSDVRVRRAIAHAIDVEFFIKNFLYGTAKPATGPIPSTSSFYPGGKQPYPFDRKRAEALLDEAGFKRGADGNRFTPQAGADPERRGRAAVRHLRAAVAGPGGHQGHGAAARHRRRAVDRLHATGISTWPRAGTQYRGDPAVSTTRLVPLRQPQGRALDLTSTAGNRPRSTS